MSMTTWFLRKMGMDRATKIAKDMEACGEMRHGQWVPYASMVDDGPAGVNNPKAEQYLRDIVDAQTNANFLAKHGLTLNSKLSDAPKSSVPESLRLSPEARSAAVARGNRTRKLRREMTARLKEGR